MSTAFKKMLLSSMVVAAMSKTTVTSDEAREMMRRKLAKRMNGPSTHVAKQSKQSKNKAKASRRKNRGK